MVLGIGGERGEGSRARGGQALIGTKVLDCKDGSCFNRSALTSLMVLIGKSLYSIQGVVLLAIMGGTTSITLT